MHLIEFRKVACVEQGGGYHFFGNHGKFDSRERQRILYGRYLPRPDPRAHRGKARDNPGCVREGAGALPDRPFPGGHSGSLAGALSRKSGTGGRFTITRRGYGSGAGPNPRVPLFCFDAHPGTIHPYRAGRKGNCSWSAGEVQRETDRDLREYSSRGNRYFFSSSPVPDYRSGWTW